MVAWSTCCYSGLHWSAPVCDLLSRVDSLSLQSSPLQVFLSVRETVSIIACCPLCLSLCLRYTNDTSFYFGSRRARKRKSRRTRMARRSHRCSMLQMTSVETFPVVLTFWGGCRFSHEMKESKEQCFWARNSFYSSTLSTLFISMSEVHQ